MNLYHSLARQDRSRLVPSFRRINEIIDEMAESYGLTRADVIGPRRTRTRVKCRREIVLQLAELGFSDEEIAQGMNRHRTSINHLRTTG